MSESASARIVAPEPARPVQPASGPPSISVVIPAFEASTTIGETIDSVLGQTRAPHEVIVADDGSTDALGDALAPFGEAVRLLRLPHRGVAAARNAGTEAASGDFVLVVDADDVLLPGKLEALGALGQARSDLDLLSTDVFFERDGRREGRFGEANPFATSNQRQAILRSCFVGWPAARRTRLMECGGFNTELRSAVDWECWIRMILGGAVAGLYDEPLAVYRVHPGSVSARRAESLRSRAAMFEATLARGAITEDERALLQRSIADTRTRATVADAEEALRAGRGDRRRRALAAARASGLPLRARAASLAAAALPGLARAWLLRSPRRSAAERRLPGDEPA
jgi:hypothetical protein